MNDKTTIKLLYMLVAFVGLAVLTGMAIDKVNRNNELYVQTQKQQLKIDAQSREISRLEQINKALANQANENKGE